MVKYWKKKFEAIFFKIILKYVTLYVANTQIYTLKNQEIIPRHALMPCSRLKFFISKLNPFFPPKKNKPPKAEILLDQLHIFRLKVPA